MNIAKDGNNEVFDADYRLPILSRNGKEHRKQRRKRQYCFVYIFLYLSLHYSVMYLSVNGDVHTVGCTSRVRSVSFELQEIPVAYRKQRLPSFSS